MIATLLFYATTVIFFLYVTAHLTWRLWKRRLSFIPSAPNVPWLGSIPYMGGSDSSVRHKVMQKFAEQFNHLYIIWVTAVPFVHIGCVEYAEAILKSQEWLTKFSLNHIFREWLGDGLAFSTGKKWKHRRRSTTPAFHFAVLVDYVDVFERHALKLVEKLMITSSECESIEIQRIDKLATLDVVCETIMGRNIDALNSDSEYVEAVEMITKLLYDRISNPIMLFSKTLYQRTSQGRQYYKCLDTLHQFTRKIILENIALRKTTRHTSTMAAGEGESDGQQYKKKRVFIDLLLDMYHKGDIDIDGIQEEVDNFMFAGHETTSACLSWTLYEIGRHPCVQRKLQEEICEACFSHSSLIDRVRSLKYMEYVIKESLRLYPPISRYPRELQHDAVINNQTFPAGTVLMIDNFSLHTNPSYWHDPYTFDPERFAHNESVKRNPYCFVPFSAGPRNCIGQKYAMLLVKVFLYHILSHFNVTSLQKSDEIIVGTHAITYSMTGIHMKFTAKQNEENIQVLEA